MKKSIQTRTYGIYGILFTAVILLIAIAINLLFSLLPDSVKKIDLSTEKLSEVSEEAKKHLEDNLDSEVNVYLVAEAGMEDLSVTEFLKNLSGVGKYISFTTLDPTVKRSFIENLTGESPDELSDNTIIIFGEKYKSVKIIAPETLYTYEAFVVNTESEAFESYGEYSYREFVSVYSSMTDYFESGYAYYETKFGGETALISAIDYVITDPENMPKVYFTTMHGETAATQTLADLLELSNMPADWITLSKALPDDAGVIVMNVPITDISESEADILENYLKSGGKLVLTSSHTHISSLKNLLSLLEKYGMSPDAKELHESNSAYYYPGYTHFILPGTDMLSQLYGVENHYFLTSSSHAIKVNKETEGISHTILLQTTNSAYYQNEESGEKSENAQYSIAVSALSSDGGEIIWFASPNILTDEDNSLTGGGNYSYFSAILGALCAKDNVSFASKLLEEDVLTISSGQASFWAVILIAIIPSVFLICGIITVRKRRKGRA
ncbi:MAG: Gldg family protein [Clostridia bacterium]|nr:Gldg family protein [Clostridia bacterium]